MRGLVTWSLTCPADVGERADQSCAADVAGHADVARCGAQAPEKGRSSAGEQQMQRSKEIAASRRPAGFRAHDAPPVNWDEDAAEQLVGEKRTGGAYGRGHTRFPYSTVRPWRC